MLLRPSEAAHHEPLDVGRHDLLEVHFRVEVPHDPLEGRRGAREDGEVGGETDPVAAEPDMSRTPPRQLTANLLLMPAPPPVV